MPRLETIVLYVSVVSFFTCFQTLIVSPAVVMTFSWGDVVARANRMGKKAVAKGLSKSHKAATDGGVSGREAVTTFSFGPRRPLVLIRAYQKNVITKNESIIEFNRV